MKCTMFLDPKVDRIVCEGELVELGKSDTTDRTSTALPGRLTAAL